MTERLVAVEYVGCEMRIVDECHIQGGYKWQRTTLSTDTVEIADADELFARLPLGAANLEAELRRSGRLAVRTSVAGQKRAMGIDTSTVPRDGPCRRATHVVGAVSLGAFKLLSGGARGAAASAGFGATVSATTSHAESIVRESGDPKRCADTGEAQPHPDCGSPIQIFLTSIDRPLSAEQAKSISLEESAKEAGGVKVLFEQPEGLYPWSLRMFDGTMLCRLPCSRWVPPNSGLALRRDEARVGSSVILPLPSEFDAGAGSTLRASVQLARGNKKAAMAAGIASGIVALAGLGLISAKNEADCTDRVTHLSRKADSPSDCPANTTVTGRERSPALGPSILGAGLLGVAASTYWFFWSRENGLEFSPARPDSKANVSFGLGSARGVF